MAWSGTQSSSSTTPRAAQDCLLPPHLLQLVTRRNREFYLPSDRAPAGSAVEAQLESLARRQTDAAKVAEEAERWERVRRACGRGS